MYCSFTLQSCRSCSLCGAWHSWTASIARPQAGWEEVPFYCQQYVCELGPDCLQIWRLCIRPISLTQTCPCCLPHPILYLDEGITTTVLYGAYEYSKGFSTCTTVHSAHVITTGPTVAGNECAGFVVIRQERASCQPLGYIAAILIQFRSQACISFLVLFYQGVSEEYCRCLVSSLQDKPVSDFHHNGSNLEHDEELLG